MKDPERLKRQQKRKEDAEKAALTQGQGEGGLKVSKIVPPRKNKGLEKTQND